ncbi:MAG: recombinase family protein [Pseudomonadota bacterium]
MKTIAYLRVSTNKQELQNQKLEILEYARKNDLKISQFIEIEISSRKTTTERRIEELLGTLAIGDTLIISELSRLGRSISEIIRITDSLVKHKVRLISIRESIDLKRENNLQTKIIITLFGIMAEVERSLISERTKMGLALARKNGKKLGRPKGSISASKLEKHTDTIKEDLKYGVAVSALARKLHCGRTTLINFIASRKLAKS